MDIDQKFKEKFLKTISANDIKELENILETDLINKYPPQMAQGNCSKQSGQTHSSKSGSGYPHEHDSDYCNDSDSDDNSIDDADDIDGEGCCQCYHHHFDHHDHAGHTEHHEEIIAEGGNIFCKTKIYDDGNLISNSTSKNIGGNEYNKKVFKFNITKNSKELIKIKEKVLLKQQEQVSIVAGPNGGMNKSLKEGVRQQQVFRSYSPNIIIDHEQGSDGLKYHHKQINVNITHQHNKNKSDNIVFNVCEDGVENTKH